MQLSDYVNSFIPSHGETAFSSLDGSDVAEWLESIGETVTHHENTGRNGIAHTASGYSVSTNGYVCPINRLRG